MATFTQIAKVNGKIETVDIKGKQYAPVNERVKAFRELYPEGYINTEILSNSGGVCVIRAEVGHYDEMGTPRLLGSGIAYEKENSSYINKTSYIENCETSAIGRAIGSIGLGIDVSYASAFEVITADLQHEEKGKEKHGDDSVQYATEEEKEHFKQRCKEVNVSVNDMLAQVGVKDKMTAPQYAKAMGILAKLKAKE